ncbi:MAG: hypothetical protein M1823_000960 [Watsoniomyces obsoletus]|nr:MAG: hypothetical protein M1823_000960 [Watsoniomyces obsoletus]
MADPERTLLNHYNLPSLYPLQWPAEKDDSEESADEVVPAPKGSRGSQTRRSKRPPSVLDKLGGSRRSAGVKTESQDDGAQVLPRKDEPDPLGSSDSVIRLLRQRGLPVDHDAKLRNQFLLSSTTFSPALFLSQVHSNASTQSLLQGLDFLSRSIDHKTASLKHLVESNFERFVRTKAIIDSVYHEMRKNGGELDDDTRTGGHSRHPSKSSGHFRSGSGALSARRSSRHLQANTKKKNALIPETEYGVLGIKTPMAQLSVKAEELWGPAMGGIEREEQLRAVLNVVGKYRGIFEAPALIAGCIKRRDYQNLAEEYARARRFAAEGKHVADTATESGATLTDPQIHQIIVTAQMWMDVEAQIEDFKRDVWRRLVGTRINTPDSLSAAATHGEDHMELIGVLLELGVQDNPIWVWLLSQYDYLKRKISAATERLRLEVEFARRKSSVVEQAQQQETSMRLRTILRDGAQADPKQLDTPGTLELWDGIYASLQLILASRGGILGEVVRFWDTAQAFIDGKTQRVLPVGIDGGSRKHHQLSTDGVRDLQNGVVDLVSLIRDGIITFFADPPPEDLSGLAQPAASTSNAKPATRASTVVLPPSVFRDGRSSFHSGAVGSSVFPPPAKLGQFWDNFAFWPPYANTMSGAHHLGKILALVGAAASEMAALGPIEQATSGMKERLRGLVGGTRERCVSAICAAWYSDSDHCKGIEDWSRSPDRKDVTNMPMWFMTFEKEVISGLQKVVYISDVATMTSGTTTASVDIIPAPRAKMLQVVRSQFVTSIYRGLSGMVEHAERGIDSSNDEWGPMIIPTSSSTSSSSKLDALDTSDRNVRMLLCLGNLQVLRREVIPGLITSFENAFSVKLTDEIKSIREALSQIDARLFNAYIRPSVTRLTQIIRAGVLSPSWPPQSTPSSSSTTDNKSNNPTEVRPYIYTALLLLIKIHTQVSSTSSPPLTNQILSYLLEQLSLEFLNVFQQRSQRTKFTLEALMQATLDVEFMSQTLNQYTTERAGEIQSQIYRELGKNTDVRDAEMRLQRELPEMRNTLKALRERSRAEFACFRKARGPKA